MPTKTPTEASAPKKKRGPKAGGMTDEHKAALATGRESSRAVRNYLEALDSHKPKRGRKRTPESVTKRLAVIEAELPDADPMRRLSLVQEQLDLNAELAGFDEVVDLSALEAAFVEHAWTYGQSKGIGYAAWRSIGVPAEVLRQAGISRSA